MDLEPLIQRFVGDSSSLEQAFARAEAVNRQYSGQVREVQSALMEWAKQEDLTLQQLRRFDEFLTKSTRNAEGYSAVLRKVAGELKDLESASGAATRGTSPAELAQMRAMLGVGPGTTGATPQQLALMKQLLGVGPGTVGATAQQVALLRSMGAIPPLPAPPPGGTTGATPQQLAALRSLGAIPSPAGPAAPTIDPALRQLLIRSAVAVFLNEIGKAAGGLVEAQGEFEAGLLRVGGQAGGTFFGAPFRIGAAATSGFAAQRAMATRAPFQAAGAAAMGGAVAGPWGALAAGAGSLISSGLDVYLKGVEVNLQTVVHAAGEAVTIITSLGHSAYGAAREFVTLGVELQKTRTTFEVLAGGRALGGNLFGSIQSFAMQSPYSVKGLSDTAQVFLGMGVGVERLLPLMRQLGDIAAGDEGRMHRLAVAVGEVMAEGRLTSFRFRQFATLGIGEADFARAMGKSIGEFRAAVHAGQVGTEVVLKALQQLTSETGRYGGMTQRVLGQVGGQWNALTQTVEVRLGTMAATILDRFQVARLIGDVTKWINANWQDVQVVITKVMDALVVVFNDTVRVVKSVWGGLMTFFKGWWAEAFGPGEFNLKRFEVVFQTFVDNLVNILRYLAKTFVAMLGGALKLADPYIVDFLTKADISSGAARYEKGFPAGKIVYNRPGALQQYDALKAALFPPGKNPLELVDKIFDDILVNLKISRKFEAPTVRITFDNWFKVLHEKVQGELEMAARNWHRDLPLGPQASKLLTDMYTQAEKGFTPFEHFAKGMKALEEATRPLTSFVPLPFFGGLQIPIPGRGDRLTDPRLQRQAAFQFYQEALKGAHAYQEPMYPTGAVRGSPEAMDMVNKASFQAQIGQRVEDILRQSFVEHQKTSRAVEEIAKKMQELKEKGLIPVVAEKGVP